MGKPNKFSLLRKGLAGAAGGTLGFITGNIPGAVAGASLAANMVGGSSTMKRKHTGRQLTLNQKRRRTDSRPTYRSQYTQTDSNMARSTSRSRHRLRHSRRRSSTSSAASALSYLRRSQTGRGFVTRSTQTRGVGRVVKRTLPQMGNNNAYQQATFKKGNKVKFEARKRPVFVSNKLRAKIKKVAGATNKYYGWYKEIQQAPITQPVDNNLVWKELCPYTSDNVSSAFSPVDILNAASVLWNTKIPTTANKLLNDTDNFKSDNFKVRVMDSNQRTIITNNTSHQVVLKLYDLSPKSTTAAQNTGFGWNPLSFIDQALIQMAPSGAPGSAGTISNSNPLTVIKETQGFNPTMIPQFKALYSIDQTRVILEPGKSYVHVLQGPKDKIYDFSKYYQSGVFNNQQKFVKHTIYSVSVEVVGTSTGALGRFVDLAANSGYGILTETTTFTKLELPEQAGFVMPTALPVAGKSQYLGNRKNSFAIKHWTVGQTGTVVAVGNETEAGLPAGGV